MGQDSTGVGTESLEAGPLKDAMDWLADYRSYWEESCQRLDDLLGELEPGGPNAVERESP